jgi:hypothetical protein
MFDINDRVWVRVGRRGGYYAIIISKGREFGQAVYWVRHEDDDSRENEKVCGYNVFVP